MASHHFALDLCVIESAILRTFQYRRGEIRRDFHRDQNGRFDHRHKKGFRGLLGIVDYKMGEITMNDHQRLDLITSH